MTPLKNEIPALPNSFKSEYEVAKKAASQGYTFANELEKCKQAVSSAVRAFTSAGGVLAQDSQLAQLAKLADSEWADANKQAVLARQKLSELANRCLLEVYGIEAGMHLKAQVPNDGNSMFLSREDRDKPVLEREVIANGTAYFTIVKNEVVLSAQGSTVDGSPTPMGAVPSIDLCPGFTFECAPHPGRKED